MFKICVGSGTKCQNTDMHINIFKISNLNFPKKVELNKYYQLAVEKQKKKLEIQKENFILQTQRNTFFLMCVY